MQPSSGNSPRKLVLASSFYTAALERPFSQALKNSESELSVGCVPYSQLHAFLLDPSSVMSEDTLAVVLVFLRVEDLIRLELASGTQSPGDIEERVRALRRCSEQFLDVLRKISHLRLTILICPSGRGHHDTRCLGNDVRITEYKIAAELLRQQRHWIIDWPEVENSASIAEFFNQSADRLGHVPFSPHGLEALANFCVARLDQMPSTVLTRNKAEVKSDLQAFLASLNVDMDVKLLTDHDEEQVVNIVRHTTHFINLLNHKWERGTIRALAAAAPAGESWTIRIRDRFGDYGLSGALTFSIESRVMRIGLLFLTCPVLGKQVEYAFLAWIASLAEKRGADWIEVPFISGRDNSVLQSLLALLAEGPTAFNAWSEQGSVFRLKVPGLAQRTVAHAPNPSSVGAVLAGLRGA